MTAAKPALPLGCLFPAVSPAVRPDRFATARFGRAGRRPAGRAGQGSAGAGQVGTYWNPRGQEPTPSFASLVPSLSGTHRSPGVLARGCRLTAVSHLVLSVDGEESDLADPIDLQRWEPCLSGGPGFRSSESLFVLSGGYTAAGTVRARIA